MLAVVIGISFGIESVAGRVILLERGLSDKTARRHDLNEGCISRMVARSFNRCRDARAAGFPIGRVRRYATEDEMHP